MSKATAERKECQISRDEFRQHAKPITVVIDGQSFTAEVKEFSTGNIGYYCGGKIVLQLNGKPVKFQMSLNIAAVGGKELPK